MREQMRKCCKKGLGVLLAGIMLMNLAAPLGVHSVEAAPAAEKSSAQLTSSSELGPTSERELIHGREDLADKDAVVLVISGDGYTRSEQEAFKTKAKAAKDAILGQSVWAEVKDSLKIYMVPVVSAESGISGENATSQAGLDNDQKDTWFKTHFWAGDQKDMIGWKNNERFEELKREYKADSAVVLMNSNVKAGSTLDDKAAVTAGDKMGATLLHELGHAVGELADEDPVAGHMTEGPNTTTQSDPKQVKWSRFIGKGGVGLATITTLGENTWYRPTDTCLMNSSTDNTDFCEVCKDHMQKKLSEKTTKSQLYFQTYGDVFIKGDVPDMKSYFILRDSGEEISGDTLGDKLQVTYYDSNDTPLPTAPETAGRYKIKGEFTGTAPYESCTLEGGTYEIKESLSSVSLESIRVSALPNKTVYKKGDTFDKSGLSITASYTGNYEKVLGDSDFRITGTEDLSVHGDKTATVTYQGKTATFPFQVLNTTSQVIDGIRVNDDDAPTISYGSVNWTVLGYKGEGVLTNEKNLTLFSQKFTYGFKPIFASSRNNRSNHYKGSGIQWYADYYEKDLEVVTPQEQAAIVRRNLNTCENHDPESVVDESHQCDGIAGEPVNNAGFWSLSAKEAGEVSKNVRASWRNDNTYWLRSPGAQSNEAYSVCRAGIIRHERGTIEDYYGLRLATYINADSILLMTGSEGGKDNQSSSQLKPMTAPAKKQKLTLIDNEMKSGTVNVYRKTPGSPSWDLQVDVQGATPNANVSAVIVNREGRVLYYGKIGETDASGRGISGSGDAISLRLPLDINAQSGNKLRIFTEKVNGDNLTDYGSAPVEFTAIPNQAPVPLLTLKHNESYNIPAMVVGTPIENIDISSAASGGKPPYRFTAAGLPAGIDMTADGIISGAPTTEGTGGTAIITLGDASGRNQSVTMSISYGQIEAPQPPAPPAPNANIDYADMKLTGLTPSITYNITPKGSTLQEIAADAQGNIEIKKEWSSKEISITKKATADEAESHAQTLRIQTIYSVMMDDREVRISVANQTITLTAPSKEGYEFAGWTVTGVSVTDTTSEEITFTMPEGDVTLTPSYTKIEVPNPEDTQPETPSPEAPETETPNPEQPNPEPRPEQPKPEPPKPEKPAVEYPDVKADDWFYGAVDYVTSNNIMSGYADNTFGPSDQLSRAQFATTLHRMEGSPSVNYEWLFSDVPAGQFYSLPVVWASTNKIITGYESGIFGTSDSITREQLATIMYRYAKYKGKDVTARTDLGNFPDAEKVSSFAKEAMSWAVAEKIISGDQGNLNPQGVTSRAVAATIIQRFGAK